MNEYRNTSIGERKGSHGEHIKRPSLSLQVIILVATLLAVSLTIFLGNRSYYQSRQIALEQFNKQQLILARSAAAGIETLFNEVSTSLLSATKIPAVEQMTPDCLEYMRHMYQGFLPKTSIRRMDENGILRFIYPTRGWRQELLGHNYSKDSFFLATREIGNTTVSGIIVNEQGNRRIRMGAPVYLPQGKNNREKIFKGILVISFDLESVADVFISPIVSGKTGYAWLLNQNGIFLAHYEDEFVGQNAFTARREKNPKFLPGESINEIQRMMLAGREGTGRYESGWHRGQTGRIEKLIAFSPVQMVDRVWSVAVVAPVSEIDEIIRSAGRVSLFGFGFIVLILISAGSFLSISAFRWSYSLEREVKNQTRELKETSDYLNNLIQSANTPIIVWSPDQNITIFNRAFEKMSGFTASEVVGRQMNILFPDDRYRQLLDTIPLSPGTGGFEVIEIPIVRKDGTTRIGQWTASNVYAEDGETLIATLAHGEDITERKEAEEALMVSEERYRRIFDAVPASIILVDKNGIMVDINSHHINNIARGKVPKEDFLGQNLITHPSVVNAGLSKTYQRVLQGVPFDKKDIYFPTTTGESDAYFNVRGVPLLKEGEIIGAVLTHDDITERKRTEVALRTSELRMKAILDAIPDLMFQISKEGVFINYKGAREDLYVEPQAFLSRNIWEVLPSDLAEVTMYNIERALQSGGIQIYEYELTVRNKVRCYESRMIAIGKDEVLTLIRDITERKQAEDALVMAMKNLSMAQEMAHVGSWDWDVVNDEMHWSDETYRLFGLEPNEIEVNRLSYINRVQTDDRQEVQNAIRDALDGKKAFESEHRIIRKDGEIRIHHTRGEVEFDSQGRPLKMTGIAQDITDLRKAEERLRLTQLSVDTASVSIFWVTPEGNIIYTNEAASRNLGYSRNELNAMNVSDVDPDFPLDIRKSHWERLKEQKILTFESRHRAKDGRIFPVEITTNYLQFVDQEYEFAFALDITERKQAEDEKKKLEAQLFHSQKIDSMGTLVAGVAHEVNNPINKILFDIPLLQKIWLDTLPVLEEQKKEEPDRKYGGLTYDFLKNNLPELLSDMNLAANRVAKTVSNLKNFTKQSSIADRQPLQINTIVENALRIIQTTVEKSGIELKLNLSDNMPLIDGNLQSLEQVIINITINAIQAIDHDHGEIEISTGMRNEGRRVFISISDNGKGIDPSISDRIFDPFITSRSDDGGTGLGLSITRNLVEAHGGDITFKPHEGKGTIFIISLPSTGFYYWW